MNTAVRNFAKAATVSPSLVGSADPNATHHLVTIHGIADNADVWVQAAKQLDLSFRSHQQLNLRWHSEVGEPYGFPDPGDVLAEGWSQLPKGRKVVLAHSFGCNALISMAQTHALDDVDALILSSPYFKPDHSAFTWPHFIRYVTEFERFLNTSIDARTKGRKISEATRATILERLKQNYSPLSWMMFFMNWTRTPEASFENFQMPCLVATGSNDFSIVEEDVETLAGKLPNGEYQLLKGLGHFSLIEDPATTAQSINNFLTKRLSK